MFLFEKRYKYFISGILVASVTWSFSLYLYSKLSSDTSNFKPRSSVSPFSTPYFKLSRKYSLNDVILPYEDNDKQKLREKKKYFEPSELKGKISSEAIVRQKLLPIPVKPLVEVEDGFEDVGLVKNFDDLKVRDEGYRLFGFNALASKNTDYLRALPDTRHKLCKLLQFQYNLPTASIIICFYNEHFDTLIRSLHSIIHRTPQKLLHEIILVNDFSDIQGLNESVQTYIQSHFQNKVKYYSTERREGLIRARIFGANKATGDVLIFLDSHIEVNVVWAEPLLQRISENRTNVVTPIIDIINADTFKYDPSPIVRGGFNWGLHFKWENLPIGSLTKESDFVKPIESPTMAGGLFAIERNYFIEMGKYDAGMEVWGGENLEMSFRVWMCGGRIEIIPCSRVGHVFRKRRPYSSPSGVDTMLKNSLRVAHVWLDEFIDNFFKHQPRARNIAYGDVTSRIELRKNLNCKSFSWYLKNVYPQLTLMTDTEDIRKKKVNALEPADYRKPTKYINHFQIRLSSTNLCVAPEKEMRTKGSLLVLKSCLRIKSQMWSETDKGELRLAQFLCLDAGETHPKLSKCHEMGGTQHWKHKITNKSPIYNVAAGTCLSGKNATLNSYVSLDICLMNANTQWDFIPVKL